MILWLQWTYRNIFVNKCNSLIVIIMYYALKKQETLFNVVLMSRYVWDVISLLEVGGWSVVVAVLFSDVLCWKELIQSCVFNVI